MWLGKCVVVCVCVSVSGEQRQIRYAVGDLPLSLALSYYGQANGNETKAVSHKPSTYFLQLLKRIECLVRPRFQLLLLAPNPPALNSCCCCCCSFVFICTGSESLCMAAFCEKKENKESREMTEADGRAAAAAYPGEAEYPCHRAYI